MSIVTGIVRFDDTIPFPMIADHSIEGEPGPVRFILRSMVQWLINAPPYDGVSRGNLSSEALSTVGNSLKGRHKKHQGKPLHLKDVTIAWLGALGEKKHKYLVYREYSYVEA